MTNHDKLAEQVRRIAAEVTRAEEAVKAVELARETLGEAVAAERLGEEVDAAEVARAREVIDEGALAGAGLAGLRRRLAEAGEALCTAVEAAYEKQQAAAKAARDEAKRTFDEEAPKLREQLSALARDAEIATERLRHGKARAKAECSSPERIIGEALAGRPVVKPVFKTVWER